MVVRSDNNPPKREITTESGGREGRKKVKGISRANQKTEKGVGMLKNGGGERKLGECMGEKGKTSRARARKIKGKAA